MLNLSADNSADLARPDPETSAKLARDLYALGQRREYANVIAFDPFAVEQLLAAIGPVTVGDSPAPISAKNVIAYLRSEHDLAQSAAKKAYIGRLANAMAAQIEAQSNQVDLWKLLAALRRVLNERHLQLALADATVAPSSRLNRRHSLSSNCARPMT